MTLLLGEPSPWVLGRHDDATCKHLLNKIGVEGKTFVTDDWEGYHRLIPESQLFTGKDLTVPIEMVDLSLRIYHHFHDNLDAFAAKAEVFQSIFG
jgi:IS1 family transposase